MGEKKKEAEVQSAGGGNPSTASTGEVDARVPSPKGHRSSSRSSHEVTAALSHRPTSKPTSSTGSIPPTQASRSRATSSASSRSGTTTHHHGSSRNRKASRTTIEEERAAEKRPEDLYELLCNGMLLPNEMTLAAVKQFKWKGGTELVMEYRRKRT